MNSRGIQHRLVVLIYILVTMVAVLELCDRGAGRAYGQQAEVPEFTAADAGRLKTVRTELQSLREQFLEKDLSRPQLAEVAARAEPLALEIRDLQDQKWRWQCHLEGRDPGEGAMGGGAVLQAAGAPAEPLDMNELLGLFREFKNLDTRRADSWSGAPAAHEWELLAGKLLPGASRSRQFEPEGEDPYVLRAVLLYGECHLFASVEHFKAGDRGAQHAAYLEGLTALERLLASFRAARAVHQSGVDGCERVRTPLPPHTGVETAGVEGEGWAAWLLSPGGRGTSEAATALLAQFCPWGLGVYNALHQSGLTDGLDWRILRPYAHDDLQYVSVAVVKRGAPPHIGEAMDTARQGSLFHLGQYVSMNWERRPEPATYTVWFTSPAVADLRTSKLVKWGLRAVKLYVGGPLDLVVDESLGSLVDVVGKEYGEDSQVYSAAGLAVDLNNFGLESDFLIEGKAFAQGKPPKEILMALLLWVENKTIELTFEGIDPENEVLRAQGGNPLSYDGTPMPAVIIRSDLLGFERVPDDKYRHTWNVLSFHQFDPRGLIGSGDRYDLSQGVPPAMDGLVSYLHNDAGVHRKVWLKLPDPLGSRLLLADFTPQVQVLRIEVEKETLQGWRASIGKEQTLAALLYRKPDDASPVAFHEIDDTEISFRINNENQLIRGGPGKLTNVFFGEEAKASWYTRDPRCDYTVKVAVIGKTEAYTHAGELGWRSDYFWEEPVKILATQPAGFLNRAGKKRTGTLSFPNEGCVVLSTAIRQSAITMRIVGPKKESLEEQYTERMERNYWISVAGLQPGLHRMQVRQKDGRTYTSYGWAREGRTTDFKGRLCFSTRDLRFRIEYSLPDHPDVEPIVVSGVRQAADHSETMAKIERSNTALKKDLAEMRKPENRRSYKWRYMPVMHYRELAEFYIELGWYKEAVEACRKGLATWESNRPREGGWKTSRSTLGKRMAEAAYAMGDVDLFEEGRLLEARHYDLGAATPVVYNRFGNFFINDFGNEMIELGGSLAKVETCLKLGLAQCEKAGTSVEERRQKIFEWAESGDGNSLANLLRAGQF